MVLSNIYGRLTGRRGYLEWADLRRVTYGPVMKWFVLEATAAGNPPPVWG